jgi:hypothetical protein
MITFADKVIRFNRELDFKGQLPKGIRIMNPFRENPEILNINRLFYERFYNDHQPRRIILGINPGRLGGGTTGIAFTDTKRLSDICGINIPSVQTHEPSSVFIYEMMEQYGGVEIFYRNYFINSICPLGFVKKSSKGNWVNYNYYDDEKLFRAVRSFMIDSLKEQINFGIDTGTCFALGKKNAQYISQINDEENFFDRIIALDHPRYIVQYRSKMKASYITYYLNKLD